VCGIGGIVGAELSYSNLATTIQQVCQNLRHRGPDDQGYFISQGVALGSTRLAIRDLALGKQPMTKNRIHIVFNGEIYNMDMLRHKMQLSEWKTHSDTEVILEGYIQSGSKIFKELAGMFAFAIWDEPKATLFLVRDRWGEKPLYYASTPHNITFASEIAGLKPWKHLKWDKSLSDILAFLKCSYIPTPNSGWKDILKLKPGCYLKWYNGNLELKRYHFPQVAFKHQKAGELRDLIESCVKKCAVSDKPIGAFLSGGIDSSTIVTYLQQSVPSFPVYSIDWKDKNYSEKKYSTALCKKLGLKHHLITCDPRFMVENFDRIVSFYGELFADESMIPTFCLARRAKEDVDVVLTGDGADEFFHGYERYFFNHPTACYSDVFSSMDNITRKLVTTKEAQKITATSQLNFAEEWGIGDINTFRARSLDDIQNYLTDDILTKVDRATMSVGLEARAPFLMPEITTFALNVSIEKLVERGIRGKWILREATKDILPPAILNRKKQGFGVPLGIWFSDELKQWMMDRLLSGALTKLGLFSMPGLEKLSQTPQRYSRSIFNLLVLESWWRKNIY
jgi:asparagine synthase (glutamine-hydrolysing)